MEQAMTDIVERLRKLVDNLLDLERAIERAVDPLERRVHSADLANAMFEAADEIELLRERLKELKPYEVVSGDTWKARVNYEMLEAQAVQIKQLEKERDALNLRIKGLQLKIKAFETPPSPPDIPAPEPSSSPELEGVRG
jgi:chromosome segregation ATPase